MATVILGEGAIAEVEQIVARLECGTILFVVDRTAYEACGAAPTLEPIFERHAAARFSDFALNPRLSDIHRGIDLARECNPDIVIALGGGTALDLGKLIGSLSVQSVEPREIITGLGGIERGGPPLIAIPTTAGTGSEATHFAVAYVDGEKHSVAHENLLPDYSIIDPRLTHSLPAHITAATGLDALCQAIESVWAVGATDDSIRFATEAIEIATANLVQVVNDPTAASRLAMCRASHLAGKAINISKTTASHALSYALTSQLGLPHGVAVAVTLSRMFDFNALVNDTDCNDPRGSQHVRRRISKIVELLGVETVKQARARFEEIVRNVGCPCSLFEAGVTNTARLRDIVNNANAERMSNNPRKTTAAKLMDLLSGEGN